MSNLTVVYSWRDKSTAYQSHRFWDPDKKAQSLAHVTFSSFHVYGSRIDWRYCQMCQKQCRDENGFKCPQDVRWTSAPDAALHSGQLLARPQSKTAIQLYLRVCCGWATTQSRRKRRSDPTVEWPTSGPTSGSTSGPTSPPTRAPTRGRFPSFSALRGTPHETSHEGAHGRAHEWTVGVHLSSFHQCSVL